MGAGGERQPRHWAARYCQYRCARGAAHRGSGRVAPEAARHAQMRSARHPARSAGAPAAEHAAALWQLCCRIGTTTTIACPVVDSRARCHRVQMATMAERGANAGTARRARDGRRAHPANRHRVCIRTRSGVRRLTILVPIGAGFGHGTRTRTLSRTPTGREASKCAVRPQSAARADHLRQITWRSYHHVGITTAVPIPREAPRARHRRIAELSRGTG